MLQENHINHGSDNLIKVQDNGLIIRVEQCRILGNGIIH